MPQPLAALAPPLSSLSPTLQLEFLHTRRLLFSRPHTFPVLVNSGWGNWNSSRVSGVVLRPLMSSISRCSHENSGSNAGDPELRSVLELASDSELYEVEKILFGPSYFSPLLKSIAKRDDVDHIMIGEDLDDRKEFISMLESRFLFLAADAKSTIRGWRPSYRNVLLEVRKKLKIPCSAKLPVKDLEVEIFLHLVHEYSSEESGGNSSFTSSSKNSLGSNNLEMGLSQWKVQKFTTLGIGAPELQSTILKGGGMLTLEKLLVLLGGRLSGKMLTEAAKYQVKKELTKKGGQLAALHLESGLAMMTAKQGLKAAAARYLGLRSLTQLLGPMIWGTLLADIVIQMLGTDYARILRAIYAFAQIRIYRSYITTSQTM